MTLQDAWALTGGCHYPYDCQGYHDRCGACPQLGSGRQRDLSRQGWQRKAKTFQPLPLTVVAISHWLGDCARASALFRQARVKVIPNGLDTQQFHPLDPMMARQILGLPQDKHLVLFGALNALQDTRKGAEFLFAALQELHQAGKTNTLELVVFGCSRPQAPPDLGFPTHYLGHLHDDVSLALLYSAADVMVVPSVQEGLGQTATEACACGTPVVAFDNSGLRDVVDHQKNGYLARALVAADLAQGIAWVLADPGRHRALGPAARQKAVQEFDLALVAHRYQQVFEDVLKEWRAAAHANANQNAGSYAESDIGACLR
jgi:glycosyltransferase involved in cell wall biosynthesis